MNLRGWSIVDCAVSLGIILFLLSVTVAARQKLAQSDAIADCQVNLKKIYEALSQYGERNGGAFPRTRADVTRPITAYTAPDAANPFGETGPSANDVTAAAFLLARDCDVPAGAFVCPGALRNGLGERDTFTADSVHTRSNFRARIQYNYSLANMYPDAAAAAAGYSLDRFVRLGASFVIAADMNAGDETTNPITNRTVIASRLSNSPNHERDGQNALHADGSVRFVPTPYGKADASFYASAGTFPQPASAIDSVLVPVWKTGSQKAPYAVQLRRWVFVGAMIFSTLLIGGVIWKSTRGSNASQTKV